MPFCISKPRRRLKLQGGADIPVRQFPALESAGNYTLVLPGRQGLAEQADVGDREGDADNV